MMEDLQECGGLANFQMASIQIVDKSGFLKDSSDLV